MGDMWAAWSPVSGETQILTDESAAVLEVLLLRGSLTSKSAAEELARDVGVDASLLEPTIELAWLPLEWAGLACRGAVSAP